MEKKAAKKNLPSDEMGPEPSFSLLLMSLASSAALALGQGDEDGGHPEIKKDRNLARFNIDLLMILKEKTRGNLTAEEAQFLERVISDLQTTFIQSKEAQ